MGIFTHVFAKTRAPEFPSGLSWLGSAPLTMKSLRGKVVLIDFWTYSCVNCIRTQEHLNRWHELYAKKGLVIIGVHTPEFGFERNEDNVRGAIKESGILYPVVLDNDYAVWRLWANRYWPNKFLVGKDGTVAFNHAGEGGYEEMETEIQKALHEIGVTDLPPVPADRTPGGGICYRVTPETYLGYLRGRIGNHGEHMPDVEEAFTDKGAHEEDVPYLNGHFVIAGDFLEHSRTVAVANEYVLLTYSAFEVNLVMESKSGKTCEVEVELDGKPINEEFLGDDVTRKKDGTTVVAVREARMYRLTSARSYHSGKLVLKVRDAGVRMYAFTFRGCSEE